MREHCMGEQSSNQQPRKHRVGGRDRVTVAGGRILCERSCSPKRMVRPGLEPGAFCVLDRCDNQLRHRTAPMGKAELSKQAHLLVVNA